KQKLHLDISFYCEMLLTIQIVLNRLDFCDSAEFFKNLFNEMQQPIEDEMKKFKPAFSFVLLQEKTLQGKSFDEMKEDYVACIQDVDLITNLFYDMEVYETFSLYFKAFYAEENRTFLSSDSSSEMENF